MRTIINLQNKSSGGGTAGRCGNIDLTRFIASLLVAGYHRFNVGMPAGGYNWAWVEYFFILSGYFTMAHIDKQGQSKEPGREAVLYTVRKFTTYFPYVFLSVLIRYFLDAWPLFAAGNIKGALFTFVYMPFEDMYLSVSGILGGPNGKLAPIWYLSAMFVVLPVLYYLARRCGDIWRIIAWIIPVLYYGQHGVNVVRGFPNDLYRAFCAMALGTLCFMAVKKLREYEFKRWQKGLLTGAEIAAFLLSVWITCGSKSFINLLLLSFPLTAILGLSQCTYTACIRGEFWTFLSKLSLPIFLFHWNVGIVLSRIDMPVNIRYLLYFGITVLVSVAAVLIVEALKNPFKSLCRKLMPVKKKAQI